MFDSVRNRFPERFLPDRPRQKYLGTSVTRRRSVRNTISVLAAAFVAVGVASTVEDARATRHAWGRTHAVVMTTTAIAAGDPIGPDDVRIGMVPLAVVPDEAVVPVGDVVGEGPLSPSDPVIGGRTTTRLGPGEMVTEADLVDSSSGRIGALLGDHESALSLDLPPGPPGLEVGDRVDVYGPAADRPGSSSLDRARYDHTDDERVPWSTAGGISLLTAGVRVLAIDGEVVTLSVPDVDVVSVLTAVDNGRVSLVMTG